MAARASNGGLRAHMPAVEAQHPHAVGEAAGGAAGVADQLGRPRHFQRNLWHTPTGSQSGLSGQVGSGI